MKTEYVSYRNDSPYPFCPGCSHTLVLDHLNAALVKLQLDPRQVVIVTDIGCSGLSDQYFSTNAFHGLHGRAVTYATGLKLANPDLKVIVIMGDGGCGIGGHHVLNAARRNIGMAVLVLNNFNYGMTGGQHSVTTPHGGITSTTRAGSLERPLDIAGTVAVNGASFVVRTTAFDKELPTLIAQAIMNEGFSLLDIWELCAAYYVPNNIFTRRALDNLFMTLGFSTGVVHKEERQEFSQDYRKQGASQLGRPALKPKALESRFTSTLTKPVRILVAGAAGQKVVSTAGLLGRGAVLSGLWATRRDDYPVTIMTGHSVSEVILSPEEIFYTGIERPDIFLALAPEGMRSSRRQFASLSNASTLYIRRDLLPVETAAHIIPLDLGRVSKKEAAVTAVAAMLRHSKLYPLDAFQEAIRLTQRPAVAEESLKAVERSSVVTD
jgi:pyruvate/2-oxoacid:ferredoxin oxidoreductase beta subunit/Pyruvate/2-oxoacid:ferredoxin oxidoreductase gamma subunit